MKENTIVSLADEKYFNLLEELIESIKCFPHSKNIAICVLDAGLNQDQIDKIKNKVDEIKKAEWDIEVSSLKVKGKEWLKSQVSRAFLPKYFPNYKKYLWIDCDAWVNDWSSIELYFKACDKGKLGITQSIGPGYRVLSKVKWLFGKFAIIKSQNFKHAISSKINMQKARKIAFAPHINIGVFSLEKSSSVWSVWQNNLKETLKHGRIFGSEGLAINLSVYVDNVDTEFLPLGCNWIASNVLPKFDESKGEFVEPYLPNNKIGIMHLAAGIWKEGKDMRLDRSVKIEIKSLNDNAISKSLRFEKVEKK
ncbi:glycosyl transferase [Candidatus Pelagibacter sp.]|nr:glycosyl transferase [Candidatus Pelagibacter sp.]